VAAVNPPWVIQASSHPADVFRRVSRFFGQALGGGSSSGIRQATDLQVTQNGSPNMSVNVAAGEAIVAGTQNLTSQGTYEVLNDATVNLAVAASDPTNPRIDIVVAQVQDAAYSGATNAWQLAVVTGTPAPSPVPPAAPANSFTLAQIAVAANATSITSGNITDLRTAPWFVQRGNIPWSVAGANSQSGTLTFPVAFMASPANVQLTVVVGGNNDFLANVQATPTSTSFLWRVFQKGGINVTIGGTLYWLAYSS
jgi:hypothetical protein